MPKKHFHHPEGGSCFVSGSQQERDTYSPIPADLITEIVLCTLNLGSSIGDISAVCRAWHCIVSDNLAQILIHRHDGAMPSALSHALQHSKLEVASELVSSPASTEDSNAALVVVVSKGGQVELARLLLTAPQNAAHADCQNGEALLVAVEHGHNKVVCMLLDSPQHAARADSQNGEALYLAAEHGHNEVVRMLLNAPQHAAHADCLDGRALLLAAEHGHSKVVRMLLDAPQHAAHADCHDGAALMLAEVHGHHEVVRLLMDALHNMPP